jgi:hypothetical protein
MGRAIIYDPLRDIRKNCIKTFYFFTQKKYLFKNLDS